MENWQTLLVLLFGTVGLFGAFIAYRKCRYEKNNLGLTPQFYIYGAFVWADMVVFGVFWFLFSFLTLYLQDSVLFLLGYSLFWVIRSLGETIYFFNQQYSNINRTTHKDFFFAAVFGNDDYTIWFVMQIFMQCLTVVSLLASLYFGKLWLSSF